MKGLFAFEAEPFEFEAYGGSESVIVRSAIRSGTTDENRLADLIFFRRHPERNGRPISRSEPNSQQLGREWLDIRDRLVRPALASTAPFPTPAPGPVPSPTGLLPVVGIEKTSAAFREKVIRIARDLGTDPNYLMAIMSFESAGFDPAARNKLSGATGLIQFMPSTAKRLGTTTDALARMSAEDQLDYVAAYFAEFKGRLKTLEDAYMAVLYRPAVGMGPEHVLFRSGDPSTGTAYAQNSPLDLNKDGRITVAEATSFVRKRFITGSRELEADFFEFTELPLSEETELGFGEAGEEEFSFGSLTSYFPSGIESVIVRSAIRSGTTNENSLTDLIFFRRHPERNGRAISRSESGLTQEWLSIRDTVVRPILRGGAPTPPAPAPAPPLSPACTAQWPASKIQALRTNIVRLALSEYERWNRGTRMEWDAAAFDILVKYWLAVPNVSESQARANAEVRLRSDGQERVEHWSAAFISWVMRNAGAGGDFAYASDHGTYIAAAYQNQLRNTCSPFKAYHLNKAVPQLGDLVCHTYLSVPADLDQVRAGTSGYHSNIVTNVEPLMLTAIGGNNSNSVNTARVTIDPSGFVTQRSESPYVGVIKVG